MDQRTIDRFWSKVDKTTNPNGCWEWMTAKDRDGYGHFQMNTYKAVKSHRFIMEHIQCLDIKHKFVCHHCDNPKCVNPQHLYVGNPKTNVKDRMERNRWKPNNKKIQTPIGIFESYKDAAKALGCNSNYIRTLVKRYPNEYYDIKEEL